MTIKNAAQLICICLTTLIFTPLAQAKPTLFLFVGSEHNLHKYNNVLIKKEITGIQKIYSWKSLEPTKNNYQFNEIKNDATYLKSKHKRLFIQIQDRSFLPDVINTPDYLTQEKQFHGGISKQFDHPGNGLPINTGWVVKIWEPAVRMRFQKLIKTIANNFDGKIYGINLPETAIDLDPTHLPKRYTTEKYFLGELDNIIQTRKAFKKSIVMQYINFLPSDDNSTEFEIFFNCADKYNIALGGPDLIPFKSSHMNNSYPYFHQKAKALPHIGIAIQEPDYTYINPKTGKPFTFTEFYHFGIDYLHADIMFWNTSEPFFSKNVKPAISKGYFKDMTGQ